MVDQICLLSLCAIRFAASRSAGAQRRLPSALQSMGMTSMVRAAASTRRGIHELQQHRAVLCSAVHACTVPRRTEYLG